MISSLFVNWKLEVSPLRTAQRFFFMGDKRKVKIIPTGQPRREEELQAGSYLNLNSRLCLDNMLKK